MILDAPNTITDVERQRRCDAHVGYPNDKWLVWTVKGSFISASGEGRSQTIGQSVQKKKTRWFSMQFFQKRKMLTGEKRKTFYMRIRLCMMIVLLSYIYTKLSGYPSTVLGVY